MQCFLYAGCFSCDAAIAISAGYPTYPENALEDLYQRSHNVKVSPIVLTQKLVSSETHLSISCLCPLAVLQGVDADIYLLASSSFSAALLVTQLTF